MLTGERRVLGERENMSKYVMLGGGVEQCVVTLTELPRVGEVLSLEDSRVVATLASDRERFIGKPYRVTAQNPDIHTTRYGRIPWYRIKRET